ncbi:neocarzinostatin apoprotein domain-containing protein [Nocardia pseudobrasiliensis]|uniref:Neocarzinostatin family protein n=1 Tax=Nocardia pseudobrasiliensis TaxID=45979 RepID=A0A370HPS4_9NOCA|nr:neocarzinostatin apoprotein domain-containing protein [Nocardia pseudobrasiliensis]RDI60576.1 neocarzinostatin family protein [Nocardia pseudobrasiliensis]
MFRAGLGCAAAAILVVVAPNALAAPQLRPSQTDNVTVGQQITVALDGLPPNMPQVAVGQCKPQIVAPSDCNLTGSLLGNADARGAWQPMTAGATVTLVATVGGVDCTAAPGACALAVTSLMNPSQILASVPLTFGPAATTAAKPIGNEAHSAAESSKSDSGSNAWPIVVGVAIAALVVIVAIGGLILRRRGGIR